MDRERAAREIKRNLFNSTWNSESPFLDEDCSSPSGSDRELEVACAALEVAISQIPSTDQGVMKNREGIAKNREGV